MLVTRRQLVAATAACATLAGAGGVLAMLPAPAPGRKLLSAGELEVVAALVEAFFPPGTPLGARAAGDSASNSAANPAANFAANSTIGSAMDAAIELDRLLVEELDGVVAPVFRHLLRGFDYATVATHGARFSHLERPLREEVLAEWANPDVAPRRMAYEVLKTCVGWAWLTSPAVGAAIGWRAECAVGAA
jgi:hypothetical protein